MQKTKHVIVNFKNGSVEQTAKAAALVAARKARYAVPADAALQGREFPRDAFKTADQITKTTKPQKEA